MRDGQSNPAMGAGREAARVSIWRSLLPLETLNAGGAGTLMGPLGIEFTEIGEDFIRGTMPVDARTHQPFGLLHGIIDGLITCFDICRKFNARCQILHVRCLIFEV